MSWLILAAGYLATHFAVYALFLRQRSSLTRETAIFGYHALSVPLLAVIVLPAADPWLPAVVGALALHGVYSLSFLELWSLAEGGYSLTIVDRARAHVGGLSADDLANLLTIGAGKKVNRLAGLEWLGLIGRRDGCVALTRRGHAVATFLAAVASLANVRKTG